MLYWLWPRIFQTKLHSVKQANIHFWVGTLGIVFYVDHLALLFVIMLVLATLILWMGSEKGRIGEEIAHRVSPGSLKV